MSTGLHLESTSRGAEELLTPPAEAGAATAIAAANTIQAKPIAPAGRRLPFGLVFSPERTLHQSIISLADQAVSSATNFATGIIIARACSKEELGLYMLGFSLIFLMTLGTPPGAPGSLQVITVVSPVETPGARDT